MKTLNISNIMFRTRLNFHISWYLATALITAVVVTQFPEYYSFTQRILLGIFASGLFFLAVIVRQLAINVISRYRHIPFHRIQIYPFGGAFEVAKEESKPILEVLLAVVGLLSSLIVVVIFYMAYVLLVVSNNVWFAWLIQWLAYINLMLFFVQFVPGYPLYGSRILLAIIWKISGSYDRAYLLVIRVGQGSGAVFFLGGLALLANRQWFAGVILAFLGWILFFAARKGAQNRSLTKSLEGMKVQQIMSQEFSIVPRQITLEYLVKDFFLAKGYSQFVIFDENKLHGVLNIAEMKSIPRKNWKTITVGEIMTPASERATANVDQSASDLLDRMNVYRITHVPVFEGNQVVGLAIKDMMVRFNKTRAKLRI
jgi:Zn-dependent protease/predicted transcriptional regulator